MLVYNSIRDLVSVIDFLRVEFYDLYSTTKNIYLIGQWLSFRFLMVSNHLLVFESRIINLSFDWLDFYEWVRDNIGASNVLGDLVRYADDLISFIRNPFDWIADAIRDNFPVLRQILNDPVSFVLETIYRYTGLDIDFVDDPRRAIRETIRDVLGDVLEIANNPLTWIQDRLIDIIPDFGQFIYDARGWVRNKIEDEFPLVIQFLNDPDGFIEDKLLQFIESLSDKYLDRVLKIGEKILNAIF